MMDCPQCGAQTGGFYEECSVCNKPLCPKCLKDHKHLTKEEEAEALTQGWPDRPPVGPTLIDSDQKVLGQEEPKQTDVEPLPAVHQGKLAPRKITGRPLTP